MSLEAEENEAPKGFGNVDKTPAAVLPIFFCALSFQIFMYSKSKSRAGPFSSDGLVCNGRSAGLYVCEVQASWVSVLFWGRVVGSAFHLGFASFRGVGWIIPKVECSACRV